MRIKIAERLRPYSHLPGTCCVIPSTYYQVQIFPTLIRIYSLHQAQPCLIAEMQFSVHGPVQDFTILNDLERGWIQVWGATAQGFMRYRLYGLDRGRQVGLFLEKGPGDELILTSLLNSAAFEVTVKAKEEVKLLTLEHSETLSLSSWQVPFFERLSLGNHKAQDWDLVKRRLDLSEIFPAWNHLGQWTPDLSPALCHGGTASLLTDCHNTIMSGKPEIISQPFKALFQAGFHGLLAPRLFDDQYQGLITQQEPAPESLSPLILLKQGACLIRSLFIQHTSDLVTILPALPPEFHCGRFLQVQTESGIIDFEWSKKTIRRLIFYAHADKEITFSFKNQIKSYRLRQNDQDKGSTFSCGRSFLIRKNCHYLFDNFK